MNERGLGLPFLLLAATAAAAEVHLLSVDDTSVRLEHRVSDPCAPPETVLVGIPPDAEPSLRLLVLEAESGEPVCGGGPGPEGWTPASPAAELLGVARFRRQRVARVRLAGRHHHRPLSRVVAEVGFGAPGSRPERPGAPGPAEPLYAGAVLNYEQARRWRLPRPAGTAWKRAGPASTGPAYKITIRAPGLYRLTGGDLAGAQGAASSGLALLHGGGRPLDPDELRGALPLEPVAVVVDDGGDGTFDEQDELLFYGEASSRWEEEGGESRWLHNPFTGENAYWLVAADPERALRIEPREPPAGPAEAVHSFTERLRLESERFPTHTTPEKIASGTDWYWLRMSSGDEETFPAVLRSPAAGTPVRIRLGAISQTQAGEALRLFWNGRRAGDVGVDQDGPFVSEVRTTEAVEGINELRLRHVGGWRVLIDWFELEYERRPHAEGGRLLLPAAGTAATWRATGFEEAPRVFAVEDGGLREVLGLEYSPAEGSVAFTDSAGPSARYAVTEPGRIRRPLRVEEREPYRLLDRFSGAAYVVVAHPDLLAEARRLAAWRAADDRYGPPFSVEVVTTEEVYDAFSGGLLDPSALRNFLYHAFEEARPAPAFVLLFGDGNFDYRDNLGTGVGNWVPPYEEEESTYDEWFVRVSGEDDLPDMAVGRIAVRTSEEAARVVDKLIAYDREPEQGPWRNRMLLAADDTYHADKPGRVEPDFVIDAEKLAAELPPDLDVEKLYLVEYPIEGRFKPRARKDFVESFSRGALLLTWVGHGNSQVLSHELIFVLSQDLQELDNGRRLPLAYGAASQLGIFDDPARDSIPEALLKRPEGGVIGMIAATRIGFHPSNMELARHFHSRLLSSGRDGVPVGQALLEAKLRSVMNPRNSRRFSLFGDPGTRLAIPRLRVELEVADTLRALEMARVRGRITRGGEEVPSFEGRVRLQVFDSSSLRRRVEQGVTLEYQRPGSPLFRGILPVTSGRFSVDFLVPRDITYRGLTGRASALAWNPGGSAYGAAGPIAFTGLSGAAPSDDDEGPVIAFEMAGRAIEEDHVLRGDASLRATLRDASGVNITGDVGHEIRLHVDDQVLDVTGDYHAVGDFRQGEVLFDLPGLEPGRHRIRLEAWDARNNWAEAGLGVRVAEEVPTVMADLLFHPNPLTTGQGWFGYALSAPAGPVRISIYTLAGRLVGEVAASGEAGYNVVSWEAPPGLANGAYLFSARVAGSAARQTGVLVLAR